MPAYRYYEDERVRWAMLHESGRIGRDEAELGIRTLAAHFGLSLRGASIEFTSGHRWSRGGYNLIRINTDYLSWLLIAHEVAHCWCHRRALRQTTRSGIRRCHNKAHRRVVDRFCGWILGQGWLEGALAHEVAVEAIRREAQAHEERREAATPPPIEKRIAQREAQVKRLETRIKALNTRLKTARRSLSALGRVKAKQERSEP